jgi:SnoaL-like domain
MRIAKGHVQWSSSLVQRVVALVLVAAATDRAFGTKAFSFPRSAQSPTSNDRFLRGQFVNLRALRREAIDAIDASKGSPIDHATVVQEFWDAYNRRNVPDVLRCSDPEIVWDDYDSTRACCGIAELERRLRLEHLQPPRDAFHVEVDNVLADKSNGGNRVCVRLMLQYDGSGDEARIDSSLRRQRRGCAVMEFCKVSGLVQRVRIVAEQGEKGGEASLQLLKLVSPLLSLDFPSPSLSLTSQPLVQRSPIDAAGGPNSATGTTPAERYFQAWNRRNMSEAIQLFAANVTYDDTAFPTPFQGKEKLRQHLELCASIFPPQLTFEVDEVIVATHTASGPSQYTWIMTLWHTANNDKPLPYTRGCSLYEISNSDGLIVSGLDFVEPNGPVKPGDARLPVSVLQNLMDREPVRWIPLATWAAYMYVVFFSDGILPGANALALEERTWKEVLDLSLNFFLVAPILRLPFSPVVHPMLEAVFNMLLSWAALFAGFLSDDRRDKPNLIPFLPAVVGMQFLTSAFLLPYLATRSPEAATTTTTTTAVRLDQTTPATKWIGEERWWGPALGGVGLGSIVWAFVGRTDEFGSDLLERLNSFVGLLSIDRVGSSFLVDLAIFAMFQGWLVDDDLKRRGWEPGVDSPWFAQLAKFVPFFGLAAYLAFRPPLAGGDDATD